MQFGKYRLVRRLAAGGMAEIFLARQEGMEGFRKELVIKRILPIHADNGELIEMFLDEARIAATLNHPNVVQIYDLGKCDGEYFIAMEYVHGQDLRKIAERGLAVGNFLPLRHAVRIIADAAMGLHYAHFQVDSDGQAMGIVHRDVSPQNIIVSFDGVVKVLDFGIAKAQNKLATTRHGQLKGKYAYMSPEQCNGLEVDHRSDIFSLGTLLYELTVCTRLFKGDTNIQTIQNVSEARVPLPTQVRPGFPQGLEEIILRSLARDPSQRYQSAQEFMVALDDFLTSSRMKAGPVQLGNYMQEIFPDKLDRPGEDPEWMAQAEAQRNAKAESRAMAQIKMPAPDTHGVSPTSAPGWTETSAYEDTPPPGNTPIPAPAPVRSPERPAVTFTPENTPVQAPSTDAEQVSFAVSAAAPYATTQKVAEPPRKKKEPRKISRSEVQVAEYHIRSTESPEVQEKGSRLIYIGLAVVVIPMLIFATYLIVKDGNFFASDESFKEAPKVDPLAGIEAPPPPPPLETSLLKVESTPPGASLAINGVLQGGETPGDFQVVKGQINTLSFYREGFAPRHKNVRVPSSGEADLVTVEMLELKTPEGADAPPKVKLTIQSEPAGAAILLNGRSVGQTPMTAEVFAGVEHHITLRKEGFHDHVFLHYVFPELDSKTSVAKMVSKERKAGDRFTEIDVQTRQVSVKVEDELQGQGPWFKPMERNRAMRIELSMAEHYPFRRVLQTTVGSMTLAPELRPIRRDPGELTLKIKNKDLLIFVQSEQYTADELKKKTLSLPAGEVIVTLVRPSDNKRGEIKVMVDPDNPSTYEIEFSGDQPTARQN